VKRDPSPRVSVAVESVDDIESLLTFADDIVLPVWAFDDLGNGCG
jgi:hypothetical protein